MDSNADLTIVYNPNIYLSGMTLLVYFQMVFDAIDTNGDGTISYAEWSYAFMSFIFVSGPESPFSLFYGPLVEPKQ